MKLAEALILRADCQKRIEQLKQRLLRSAKVQEGESPPEDPSTLLEELNAAIDELTDLIKRINQTNSQTSFENEENLTDALADRDTMLLKRNAYSSLVQAAATKENWYSRSEIKYFSTVNVAQLQRQVDRMSRDYRQLDTQIQQANWNTELVE